MNEQGKPLESQIVDTPTEFTTGETSDTQSVTFSQAGQRVLVYPLAVDDMLRFEGLPITLVAASITALSFMGFGGIIESIFGA